MVIGVKQEDTAITVAGNQCQIQHFWNDDGWSRTSGRRDATGLKSPIKRTLAEHNAEAPLARGLGLVIRPTSRLYACRLNNHDIGNGDFRLDVRTAV
jgi:hypothetical protein